MSLISDIVAKIFNPSAANATPAESTTEEGVPSSIAAPASTASQPVDVDQVLSKMAAGHQEKLNWRTSIVDLLKILGLESGLSARQELARELKYDGDLHDSAAMNIWLSKQVLRKLSENGGHVPPELMH